MEVIKVINDHEFEAWCKKNGLSAPAIEIVKRIRENEPSRNVKGGRYNVIGKYPSLKMGRTIQFESHRCELPAIYQMEYLDDSVLEFYDQPGPIKLLYKAGKNERLVAPFHTPDFFVIRKDSAGWEEWKTEEQLIELASSSPNRYVYKDGQWRCPPGEAYAAQFGLYYRLRSTKEINNILYRNIVFLEDYYLGNQDIPSESKEKVLSLIKENPGILLVNLIDEKKVDADTIYNLLVRCEIYINIEEELISEPDLCHVFANQDVALAYQAINSDRKDSMFANCMVDVAPGKEIIWGNILWMIVNMDDKYISVQSPTSMNITQIKREQFVRMVSEGLIRSSDNQLIDIVKAEINSKLFAASKRDLARANEMYNTILPYLEGKKLEESVELNVTTRTIRNWLRRYRHGELVYGSGYIGLLLNIKDRGNRTRRIPEDTILEFNRFMDVRETPKDPSKIALYGEFKTICEEKGLIAPSLKTFYNWVKQRPAYERLRKTKGERAAYAEEPFIDWIDQSTPRHGDRALEIAHLDHTEADMVLRLSRTGKKCLKFWLTILYDAYSRRVLAFYVTFQSPSYVSDMMVLRECVRRFGRLPHIIVTDNGADFRSVYFQSLLACFGVIHKKRPPHKSRHGSVCERYFGITTVDLLNNLRGNTKITKKVRQVTKSVDPKNQAVWTLPLIYELLREYFYEEYDTMEHSTLGESPREAFERSMIYSGRRETRYIAYNTFKFLSMPEKGRKGISKVGLRGVRVNYFYYNASELRSHHGEDVPVRYDPWNMGHAFCYVDGRWIECKSEIRELQNRTEMEVQIASDELRKQKQDAYTKSRINRAQVIAKLLSRAEQTEKMLLQREYYEEMRTQLQVINGGIDDPVETDESKMRSPNITDENLETIRKALVITDIDFDQEGSN